MLRAFDDGDSSEQVNAEAREAIKARLQQPKLVARGVRDAKRGVGSESQAEASEGRVRKASTKTRER